VQSSTCLLLAAHRRIPTFDAAIFVDTGWEPAAVFEHLDRRFASMPLFTLGPRGERGMARRQCTSE
jgi:glutathione S-transferase